jgi:hypothetical protein
MNEFSVSAHGDYLCTDGLEILVLLCQSSELGCSDKGEVSGIKEEYRPFLGRLQLSQTDLSEIPLCRLVCLDLEIRYRVSYLDAKMVAHVFPLND